MYGESAAALWHTNGSSDRSFKVRIANCLFAQERLKYYLGSVN
jgi:hypothetical protein